MRDIGGSISRAQERGARAGLLRWERGEETHRVAVLVPMAGSAGIWGPSCISCAQLAIDEINATDGIGGRLLEPIFLNSDADTARTLEAEINGLLEQQEISGVVGMSVSSVRQRLNKIIAGRVPHVYTPQYEGHEHSENVFTIGDTPDGHLIPSIRRLTDMLKVRRWALIGNDYVWPRVSHAVAKRSIADVGGAVVFDGYVPFGLEDAPWLVERIVKSRPDIVLVSLIGQDAVEFNRSFGAMGLDRRIFRLSTVIEENVLLASESANTKRLYVAGAYFATLDTDHNLAFKERYEARHTKTPPMLNSLGQSVYEGLNFYSALMRKMADTRPTAIDYASARVGRYYSNERKDTSAFLARADGVQFCVTEQLS
ncbi:MAG: substrate-binding domain-containing protein [Rhizobiaceae bacterium]|nr:substrate-binding domain-containing protein [Rhizobiaceae bacterium]